MGHSSNFSLTHRKVCFLTILEPGDYLVGVVMTHGNSGLPSWSGIDLESEAGFPLTITEVVPEPSTANLIVSLAAAGLAFRRFMT